MAANRKKPHGRRRMHLESAILASFLAALVEGVEALTVILAVGSARGWRGALLGCTAGLAGLSILLAIFGRALEGLPVGLTRTIVGALLVLFGLRWLRKAILRAAGVVALRDEAQAYQSELHRLRGGVTPKRWDALAIVAAFQVTMLEGGEVIFIVLANSVGGGGLLKASIAGATAAIVVVVAAGIVLHRPLARAPENQLKFVVGAILSGAGSFWFGEGIGLVWPGDDWSLLLLAAGYFVVAALAVLACKRARRSPSKYNAMSRAI
jgi:Ca2+/H+ antiporter, TMEM165/GDT1 family